MLCQVASPSLSPGLQVCALGNRIKENLFKMEQESPEGEALMPYHSPHLADTPTGRREIFSLPSNWTQAVRNRHGSANGKPLHLNSRFPPKDILLITASPNSHLFLYNVPLLGSLSTCLRFAIAWVSQIVILLPLLMQSGPNVKSLFTYSSRPVSSMWIWWKGSC